MTHLTSATPDGPTATLLIGAAACALAAGADAGPPSPVPAVPDIAAVITPEPVPRAPTDHRLGPWRTTWTDHDHAAAVADVRAAIARGDVYQVNVVGHRSAHHSGDPTNALHTIAALPGATHGGLLTGDGWAIATASPECLLHLDGTTLRTRPIKGTAPATDAGARLLRADQKERAEHIMIVDLERNDLGRVATPGSVHVDHLYALREWCGLWQAESVIRATLRPDADLADLLRAVLPSGSVTGAPKLAALAHTHRHEPVGRGPAMGAFGTLRGGHLHLGLTIRTLAADTERLHLWAGGGITWGSDPHREVAEAHAKAAPLLAALARPTRSQASGAAPRS